MREWDGKIWDGFVGENSWSIFFYFHSIIRFTVEGSGFKSQGLWAGVYGLVFGRQLERASQH